MKKKVLLLLTVILVLGVLAVHALAAEPAIVAQGSCSDTVFWELDENGKLTISGTGAMPPYYSLPPASLGESSGSRAGTGN